MLRVVSWTARRVWCAASAVGQLPAPSPLSPPPPPPQQQQQQLLHLLLPHASRALFSSSAALCAERASSSSSSSSSSSVPRPRAPSSSGAVAGAGRSGSSTRHSNSSGGSSSGGGGGSGGPRRNFEIRGATHVRLIDADGQNLGLVTFPEAMRMATAQSLDLVEVGGGSGSGSGSGDASASASSAAPAAPVCKLMDYGQRLYQMRKKSKEMKKARPKEVKEIHLTTRIEMNDFTTKMRQMERFLEKGHTLRVVAEGKEPSVQERRESSSALLDVVRERLAGIGDAATARVETIGRNSFLMFNPARKAGARE
jgi:translation initiation factor IF-3